MSKTPYFAYYEHIAKLAQVANKQTLFLAHILYLMEFSKEYKQYYVDMSRHRKLQIMKQVSPDVEEKNALVLANQYLNKLKKADFVKSIGGGVWLVNPSCYGKYKTIPKDMRQENEKIFLMEEFTPDALTGVKIVAKEGNQ